MEENENLNLDKSDEISTETLGATILFELLSAEAQEEILTLMREMIRE